MTKILIIVDPQNDFCEGGSLAVPKSNDIFVHINNLRKLIQFDKIIVTMDWHAPNHISFAQNHNLQSFSKKQINGQQYTLWPVHCIQQSKGAQISKLLNLENNQIYVKKGKIIDEQQYSGFGTQKNPTQLVQILKENNAIQVYVVGLALDFCVGNTALDSKKNGFDTIVVKQCTKGVTPQTIKSMLHKFKEQGIKYKSIQDCC